MLTSKVWSGASKGARPDIASVASLFVSRWDAARHQAAGGSTQSPASRSVSAPSRRIGFASSDGSGLRPARPQRLLWASTSAKDPTLPDTYYVTALAAENTVNTMPEATLLRSAATAASARCWRPTRPTPRP